MINEHDIREWDGQKYQVVPDVKLHDVPRNSWIQIEDVPELVYFYKVDGMYSLCDTTEGLIHLAAWTVVDYWKPLDAPENS